MDSHEKLIKKLYPYLEKKMRLFFYRKMAHRLRKKLVAERGYEIVDHKMKMAIKKHAKEMFGSASYWPWLSLYTEMSGNFKEGWLPFDYFFAYLIERYNPVSIRISDYKTFDSKMFPDFALKPLVIKVGNMIYDGSRNQISFRNAENILYDYNDEIVLKEDLSRGGHDVTFMSSRKFKPDDYSHISSYVIQPVLRQHKSLMKLNDKAVSTIRILSYLNGHGDIEVKYALLRFGIGESRVDNTSSGGGYCFIKSDGSLENTAYARLGLEIGKKHPDSKMTFGSVIIPNYPKVLQQCIKAHKEFPYFRFIGWDVAIDKSGEPVLLEWNEKPGIWAAEALRGPLFKKELEEGDFKI